MTTAAATATATPRPDPLALFERPARLGALGAQARRRAFADLVWVRSTAGELAPRAAALGRGGRWDEHPEWPEASTLRPDDHLVVHVDSDPDARARFVAWLHRLAPAAPSGLSVAPFCRAPGGMHRLWCIGAARVLLPDHVHVEARHDLIGIRLAQLALGFGADILGGPIEPDRRLPLAGVTRPDENTPTGLSTLVRQVGLRPRPTPATQTPQ